MQGRRAMARPVEYVKTMPTPNCRICFAPEAPFLATGSGSGCTNLRILRACPALDRKVLIGKEVAEFSKPPAAFCRLCWSKPLGTGGSSCPAGLIAGGLESGDVAVWDPRKALSEIQCLHPDENIWVNKLQEFGQLDLEYDFCETEKRQESPLLQEKAGNLAAAESLANDLLARVARFSKHVGSVRGLEFSSHWPNLIGSGATNGRLIVWDLANPYAETVPTWETETTEGDAISCLSWSPLMPKLLGSTSLQGLCFWDIRSCKSPTGRLSGLAFSPTDKNSVVVSCEDFLDTPSLSVWDLRNVREPVKEVCENSKGIIAMAWSPHYDDALLVSSKNDKIMIWNLEKYEAIWKGESYTGRCYDVQWSPSNPGVFVTASHNNLELFKLQERYVRSCPACPGDLLAIE